MFEALDVAFDLCTPEEELQAEGHRLGVDAVCASDAWCVTELICAAAQDGAELLQIVENDGGRVTHHDAVCRVLHIARGESLVDVFRVLADVLFEVREEGNDVVVGGLFDLVDARDVELCLCLDVLHGGGGDLTQLCHRFARGDLDVQNGLPLILDRPEMPHLRSCIAFYHVRPPD